MENWKNDRIASAVRGENPTVIAKMKSGFAVIGDTQFLPGYCVLLAYPKVSCLNDLSIIGRQTFLTDMTLIGDAITKICNPIRINYEILGNLDNFLHAHIFPRYEWEEESIRKGPVFKYPSENWSLPEYQFCESKHGELKRILTWTLNGLMNKSFE